MEGQDSRGPDGRAMLTVAVSSRALFHLEEANAVFEREGEVAFDAYMRDREAQTLEPGTAFPLVRKLLGLNRDGVNRVDVVLLSRNSPQAGLRVMASVQAHGLGIERAVFAQGTDRFRYARAVGADLFLSANGMDVEAAIRHGVAAATMIPRRAEESGSEQVRIAFDGDSVLFGGSADAMYHSLGMEKWREYEVTHAAVPLEAGPFKGVIERLHRIRASLTGDDKRLLRLALITARGAPAHERALRTLQAWGVAVDEAVFCGGLPKGPLALAYGADVLFDDVAGNIASAEGCDVTTGHVRHAPAIVA